MRDERSMIRLYVDAPLSPGATLTLPEKQSHYLLHVMRLKEGDALSIFNGRDGQWRATLTQPKKHGAALVLHEQQRMQKDEAPLTLYFAPIKRGHGDLAVEKASELGVTTLIPLLTARTVATRVPLERLQAIAIEAAEQCERLSVPQLMPPRPLESAFADGVAGAPLFLCAEFGEALPIATALEKGRPAGVIIGPEGGFTPDEMAFLRSQRGIIPVSLGPRVLRADTAAIAALSVIQALRGDWTEARHSLG